MLRINFFLGFFILVSICFSQTITTGQGINYYVNDVLVGGGITTSNITINTTDPDVIGEFSNCASTNIGLDRGVIIACGDINLALNANTQQGAGDAVGTGSDTDLQQLLGSNYSIKDAIVIEFDFIPLSNHVEFNYVFASEEFPEYVNSNFNDVFGFFVSGPGISGPYSNNSKNVALMPGGTQTVTINNVYNTAYYVDNTNGQTIEYDGFTTVLTASFDVTPCQVYHIKIAVGDAGDSAFDSAIFLKATSFSSNALNIDVSFTNQDTSGIVIEGCSEAIISFTFDEAVNTDTSINYTIQGTANNGTDYTHLDGVIQFAAGEDSTAIVISPILDTITENNETILIIIQTSVCGTDTVEITIIDDIPIIADFTTQQQSCAGDTVIVQYTGNGTGTDTYTWDFAGGTIISGSNQGPFQIVWDNAGSHNVSLQVDAQNACSSDSSQETITIYQIPTATFTSATICEGSTAVLYYTGNASNAASYTWTWPDTCSGANLIGSDTNPDSLSIQFNIGTAATCSPATITLQVEENGCVSDLYTGSVNILPTGTSDCCEIPNPNAGLDANVCGLTYNLNGDAPAPGNNMEWVIINSPTGSIVTFSNVHSWTSIVTVSEPGDYTFGYHEISGNCDSTDNITISFYPTIHAYAGNDTSFCATNGTLNATLLSGNNGTWLNTSGVIITPSNSPTASVSGTYGTYILYWIETDANNICTDTSTVQISFMQTPTGIINGSDTCGNTVHLSVDTTGNWGTGFHGYWT